VANAAFFLGLMKGMPPEFSNLPERMEFDAARHNFNVAARQGLTANFTWPGVTKPVPSEELILKELLPVAKDGLRKADIAEKDVSRLLGVIEERVRSGQTGSRWMLSAYEKLCKQGSKDEALVALTAGMSRRQQEGSPAHTWDLPDIIEAGSWKNRYWTIEQVMRTDLITVSEDDPVDLVANMMFWRNIRHVPVENEKGDLTGLVSCTQVMLHYANYREKSNLETVKNIMTSPLVTVSPQTKTQEAIQLMNAHQISCLPVVLGGKLVGLVTERDFMHVSAQLMLELTEGQ
jgi:CBS domain-containing protein